MNQLSRKTMIGTFALLASLSAPLAFAQDAAMTEQAPPAEQAEAATATEATAATETPATEATTETEATTATEVTAATDAPVKKSWTDVDADKDGALSKTEAAVVPALVEVFDLADGDADGTLTADEYKAYVAKVQGGAAASGGGAGE